MELNEKDEFCSGKKHGEGLKIHPANLASDWQFGANQQNRFHSGDSVGASTSRVSASMADSFSPHIWDHPHSQNLACGQSNLQTSTSSSYLIPGRMLAPCSSSRSGLDRPLEYGWNSSNSLPKGAVFLQTGAGILHQSLSQFPSDSGFVERAAHLSCFSSGNFGEAANSFQNMEPLITFPASGNTHGTDIPLSSNVKLSRETQSEEGELMSGAPIYVSSHIDHGATIGNLEKDDEGAETLVKMSDEENFRSETKPSENGVAEFSGNVQSDPSMNLIGVPEKEVSTKKRKKSSQDSDQSQVNTDQKLSAEAAKEISHDKQKDELAPSSAPKSYGKSAKENLKNSDVPKEDYIHVRARRGQATNSHSLAERVRREKISERMKLLQDLVPGCSKVTGKAVMLDEIINYVQSLQRQVEFLSMKLATVNPRLDFNLENLLSRDILQSRGSSSSIGFSPDMTMPMVHPQLHLSQHHLMPTGIPGIRSPSSALRRSTNSPIAAVNEFKEGPPQAPDVWEAELPNVVQMNFNSNMPFVQESSGPLPRGHMKVEL